MTTPAAHHIAKIAGTFAHHAEDVRRRLDQIVASLEVIAAGQRHQLKLTVITASHPFQATGSWILPYCPCGWVGHAVRDTEPQIATNAYRRHLLDQEAEA